MAITPTTMLFLSSLIFLGGAWREMRLMRQSTERGEAVVGNLMKIIENLE
jgi:hypothetical protein